MKTRTVKIDIGQIKYASEFYPREKPRQATIEQYVDAMKDGAKFPPIDVDEDGYILLDGYHRWKAYQEAGIEKVEVNVVSLDGFPKKLYGAGQNAGHGDRLSLAEKKAIAREEAAKGTKQSVLKQYLKVSAGTISEWVHDITQRAQRSRDARIWWFDRLGWTQVEIGERIGIPQRTVAEILAKSSEMKKSLKDQLSRGRTAEQIAEAEGIPSSLVEVFAIDGDDSARFAQLKIGIQPYDVWTFSGCDPRFGGDYPGRVPGQLIAHLCYFYTSPDDTIIDPMVGSGTTIDVCAYLGRKCYGYDAHPIDGREDIIEHDIRDGWPERTKQAKLVFWDPPYFKKKDDGYGEKSISRLDRVNYLQCFSDAFKSLHETVKPGTVLAFLMSDWDGENWEGKPGAGDAIFVWDYADLLRAAGWKLTRQIQVPLSTQQIHPDIVTKFRASKRLARLERYIIVAQR